MSTEILQVRGVSARDARVLRERAAARGVSLSSYLRELIHDAATAATMEEVVTRVSSREGIEADRDQIRAFIEDGHR